jgi:hypothetical protein
VHAGTGRIPKNQKVVLIHIPARVSRWYETCDFSDANSRTPFVHDQFPPNDCGQQLPVASRGKPIFTAQLFLDHQLAEIVPLLSVETHEPHGLNRSVVGGACVNGDARRK